MYFLCFLHKLQDYFLFNRILELNMKVETQLTPFKKGLVGVQFLFVAFGATVLVPLLIGIDPAIALLTAGVGTLIFHLVTKGIVPIYLGSSFAFVAPIIKATELYGLPGAMSGVLGVSLVYFLVSAIIKWRGVKLLERLFPSVVVGPIILLIGLSLAKSAVNMSQTNWVLAMIALVTATLVSVMGKGILRLISIFCGIVVGYIAALIFFRSEIDFNLIKDAPWLYIPEFHAVRFSWKAILYMIPVAVAPVIEHIGDVYVVNQVTDKDFTKEPGLHRTLLGDGLACLFASLIGGPPVTTYSEVTGAMTVTKVKEPSVMRIAAVTAILFSILGKINAFLHSIPQSVLGGIMLLLFGTIASAGVSNMIHNKVDFSDMRNVAIFGITMTIGIGDACMHLGSFSMGGIALAAIVAIVLNLVLPHTKKEEK